MAEWLNAADLKSALGESLTGVRIPLLPLTNNIKEQTMKSIKVILPNKSDIRIIPFADLHLGSSKCNLDLIQKQIEKVKNDENTFAIIVGDLINNSTKTSVGDVFTEVLNPMEQMKLAVDLFEPIKEKILAITAGNHERRSYKNDGTDLGWFFANSLGLGDRYDYVAPLLFLKVGYCNGHNTHNGKNQCASSKDRKWMYTIYITHGDGANGRLVGGKANSLERRGAVVDADVIITGHTHQPLTFKQTTYVIDRSNYKVDEREQTFVNCASTLNYEGYAELYGMRPSSTAQPEIILGGARKEVKVVV